ncbi:MAG TPA: NAD(P)/FAD-dependent oxidoreductase [Cyanothece sp. UBA12306]|nr:NAD(P)/FAD-dependent oxidoreductase [Cyanothece sp. UBA12306]
MINNMIKICILGGGFGGLYTALYLNNHPLVKSRKCQITLVERNDNFLFTPLLYELITGELQRWEIAPTYQKLLAKTSIKFSQNTIKDIDFSDRQVGLANGDYLSYDYLVLAVGTQNRWVNIPGLRNYALTFRTLADLERLQGELNLLETSDRKHLKLAIIGGGPNGVELACKLADYLGKRGEIILIERGNQILKGFSKGVKSASYKALGNRGVQIYLDTRVNNIESDSITLTRHEKTFMLAVDRVIWVAGTTSREWVKNLGVKHNKSGKILTLSSLQLLDYPEVFALGDIAEISHSNQWIPATAQVAYQQANCTAKNIIAAIKGKKLHSFYYLHLGDMLTLGKGAAIVSSFSLNIEGYLASVIRRLAYIFRLPTLRHRNQVLRNLQQKVILKIRGVFSWKVIKVLLKYEL